MVYKRHAGACMLATFMAAYLAPRAQANVCVQPKIKSAAACGIVYDPYGIVIPGVTITLKDGINQTSATTNDRGEFRFEGFNGSKVVVKATANGFMTAESSIIQIIKPAKICKKPILVMLQVGGDGCAMVSLKKSDLPIVKRD